MEHLVLAEDGPLRGDLDYIRFSANARGFYPIGWEFFRPVLRANATLGQIYSTDGHPVPIFERFFGGPGGPGGPGGGTQASHNSGGGHLEGYGEQCAPAALRSSSARQAAKATGFGRSGPFVNATTPSP